MKYKVFLDTNVFIFAFEFRESNSAKILELLNNDEIEAVISEKVLFEVISYFSRKHSLKLARQMRRYLLDSCILILNKNVKSKMEELKGKIKEKDLEQISAVKKFGIKYIVALDRDFQPFEEYVKPKEFVKLIGEKEFNCEY